MCCVSVECVCVCVCVFVYIVEIFLHTSVIIVKQKPVTVVPLLSSKLKFSENHIHFD